MLQTTNCCRVLVCMCSLAREPAAVVAFLRQLGEAVKGKADAEVAVLQKHKASELQSVEPHTVSGR